MNNRGFLIAYTGMLDTAARREANRFGTPHHARRRKIGLAARLFGFV